MTMPKDRYVLAVVMKRCYLNSVRHSQTLKIQVYQTCMHLMAKLVNTE